MKKLLSKKAFTLIELLLAVSLLSIVMSSLYSFFYSGKKVYQSIHEKNLKNSPITNCTQILRRDLGHMIKWHEIHFVLEAYHLYFFTASEIDTGKIERIDYRVVTRYHENHKIYDLLRTIRTFPYNEEQELDYLPSTTVLQNCDKINFKAISPAEISGKDTDLENAFPDEDDSEKTPKKLFYDFITWKRSLFPAAMKLEISLNSQTYSFLEWLPQYRHEKMDKPLLSISEEEYQEMNKQE